MGSATAKKGEEADSGKKKKDEIEFTVQKEKPSGNPM